MGDQAPETVNGTQPRSIMRRRAPLVLTTAALVVAGAWGYATTQTPTYTAHARVLIEPFTLPNAANPLPDIGTEQAIATSGTVMANAARAIGDPVNVVRSRADVSVVPNASVLDFGYSAPDRDAASHGSTSLAAAYMAYRATTGTSTHGAAVVNTLSTPKVKTRLITSATPPGSPSAPDLIIDLIAGLLVGLIAGTGVAFTYDRFTQRLRSVVRWQEVTGVPVLAGLPRDSLIDDSERLPGDDTALALRYLRMRVAQALPGTGSVVLITEVHEQPERPALARTLANGLVHAGRSAALIELTREAADPELRMRLSQTLDPGVALSPAGAWTSTDVDGLLHLIDRQRHMVDVVVVTSPPVTASITTLDVAGVADNAVVLDNAGTARRNDVLRVLAELRASGCAIAGGVLLGLPRAQTGDPAAMPAPARTTASRVPDGWTASQRRTGAPVAWATYTDTAQGRLPVRDHANGSSK